MSSRSCHTPGRCRAPRLATHPASRRRAASDRRDRTSAAFPRRPALSRAPTPRQETMRPAYAPAMSSEPWLESPSRTDDETDVVLAAVRGLDPENVPAHADEAHSDAVRLLQI